MNKTEQDESINKKIDKKTSLEIPALNIKKTSLSEILEEESLG